MSLNFQIHFSLVDSQFDVIKMAQTSNVLLEWSSYAILELRSLLLYWDTIIMLFGVFSLFYINSSRLYMRLNCRQNECIIKYQPENGISDGDDNNNMLTNYNNSNIPFYNKIQFSLLKWFTLMSFSITFSVILLMWITLWSQAIVFVLYYSYDYYIYR